MMIQKTFAIQSVARVLGIVCDDDTIAAIMNATLSAESDDRLSDYQAEVADVLFDALTDARTDVIPLAQGKSNATI